MLQVINRSYCRDRTASQRQSPVRITKSKREKQQVVILERRFVSVKQRKEFSERKKRPIKFPWRAANGAPAAKGCMRILRRSWSHQAPRYVTALKSGQLRVRALASQQDDIYVRRKLRQLAYQFKHDNFCAAVYRAGQKRSKVDPDAIKLHRIVCSAANRRRSSYPYSGSSDKAAGGQPGFIECGKSDNLRRPSHEAARLACILCSINFMQYP